MRWRFNLADPCTECSTLALLLVEVLLVSKCGVGCDQGCWVGVD